MGPPTAPYGYAPKENFLTKGFMPKLWVLLILIGFLLVAVGALDDYGAENTAYQCEQSTPVCSSAAADEQNAEQADLTYLELQGIGFLLVGLGFGLSGLAYTVSKSHQEHPAAAAAYPAAAPAAAPAWSAPPAAAPAYAAPAAPAYTAPAAPAAAPVAAAAPAAGPACKSCGKTTTWIPQYSRYYCQGCAQYV